MALLTVYVDHAAADTSGVGSAGDPWKYIYQATGAMKTDAGTNQYKVWIKASATYGTDENVGTSLESDDVGHDGAGGNAGAVLWLDQAGTLVLPNVFEGYHTTIGDGGIVKIDCQGVTNQLANGVFTSIAGSINAAFKNLHVTNASGDGFSCNGDTDDNGVFKNCIAHLNGGDGFSGDNNCKCICCVSQGNTGVGFDFDLNNQFVACISHGNTYGFFTLNANYYNCLAYDNSIHDFRVSNSSPILFGGCTSDGENAAGDYCIWQDAATGHMVTVVNCILHDGDYGIFSDSDSGEMAISRHKEAGSATWLAMTFT